MNLTFLHSPVTISYIQVGQHMLSCHDLLHTGGPHALQPLSPTYRWASTCSPATISYIQVGQHMLSCHDLLHTGGPAHALLPRSLYTGGPAHALLPRSPTYRWASTCSSATISYIQVGQHMLSCHDLLHTGGPAHALQPRSAT